MAMELQRTKNHNLLLLKDAQYRIVDFLLEMKNRQQGQNEVDLPMTRVDIADYLGLSIETVSRMLTRLKSLSAISFLTSRRVILRDLSALRCINVYTQWTARRPARRNDEERFGRRARVSRALCPQGHSAPVSIQAWIRFPSWSWVPGAGIRPAPGLQAHATKSSFAMCSCSNARLRPPLRVGSLIWRQISPTDLPSHAISSGASAQRGCPGML